MTEGNLIYKILGALLILVGVILVSNPELVSNKPVPEDIFKAVERRVWWGLFISAGTLLMFHHQLQPWLVTFVATSTAITFGLLAARLIGIVLDGSVPKQWLWVAVEAVALAGLAWWYANVRT
jgi:hypothetical protein